MCLSQGKNEPQNSVYGPVENAFCLKRAVYSVVNTTGEDHPTVAGTECGATGQVTR